MTASPAVRALALARLVTEPEVPVVEIARSVGVTTRTLRLWARDAEIPPRARGGSQPRARKAGTP